MINEFLTLVLKLKQKRKTPTAKNLGMKNCFLYCKKQFGLSVSKTVFSYIIKEINKQLVLNLLSGLDIEFPQHMGRVELCKYPAYFKIKEGKVITNRPVNWQATLKLWEEDSEARDSKLLVRHESAYLIKIGYNKLKAKFKNKSYFEFLPSRSLKLAVANKLINNELDAFLFKT